MQVLSSKSSHRSKRGVARNKSKMRKSCTKLSYLRYNLQNLPYASSFFTHIFHALPAICGRGRRIYHNDVCLVIRPVRHFYHMSRPFYHIHRRFYLPSSTFLPQVSLFLPYSRALLTTQYRRFYRIYDGQNTISLMVMNKRRSEEKEEF